VRACLCSCGGPGTSTWLITCPTTLTFRLSLVHFLHHYIHVLISYTCRPFMALVWSYHWSFRYPFPSAPFLEWTYSNPQHTLKYSSNYCFGEWNTCSKGGLPPFPSPHPTTNGYPYHQRRLPNFDGCCHCRFDSHKYGVMNINNNNTCSNNGCLKEDTILHRTNTRRSFHSPCYWNMWVPSFSFWFIIDNLCTKHYHASSMVFFSPLHVCLSLSTMCVYNFKMYANHSNSSIGYYIWLGFFISSTHHNYCTCITNSFVANDNVFVRFSLLSLIIIL
jgi:hypothetical protein